MSFGGNTGDDHAFDDPVRIAFHHGAVHKGSGIALVSVADNVFFRFGLAQYLLPFPSGGETGAASSTQACIGDLLYDLFRRHIEQGLGYGTVTADGDIFDDGFSVDVAAVFQGYPHLLFIEGNVILALIGDAVFIPVNQTVHHFIAENTGFDDFLTVFRLYLNIKPAHGFDPEQRPHLAEAVAAAFFQADGISVGLLFQGNGTMDPFFFHQFLHPVENL